MSTEDRRQEQSSTYFVTDHFKKEELIRLQIQDRLLTIGMGGVLPEQPNPARFQRVLDVGCGTGGWLIEAAKAYPTMSLLAGVDISARMIEYARALAETQQVSNRVEFAVMDVLHMLKFPAASFDLINQRLAISYLRTWDWAKLLNTYHCLLRPGGVIRLVEPEIVPNTSSLALAKLFTLLLNAFYQSGHLFTPASDGLTSQLPDLLEKRYGFSHVETCTSPIIYHSGTPEAQQEYEDLRSLFRTVVPFLKKWSRFPGNYEELYQQALNDMQQPGFALNSRIVTIWGLSHSKAELNK